MRTKGLLYLACFIFAGCASMPLGSQTSSANSYTQVNLVANKPDFKPLMVDPDMQNAWGLANRPAGFGGHFWVTTQKTGKSIQYVGDVQGKPLFQDDLKIVTMLEGKKKLSTPTGVVFNPGTKFRINQPTPQGSFKSESKFIFVTDSGKIYGWAEKKKDDGSFIRSEQTVLMVDNTKRGDQYFGLGIDPKGERLFVADFGTRPQLRVFDAEFKEIKLGKDQFKNPFIKGLVAKGGEYAPFNAQVLQVGGQDRVFVAYAMIDTNKKNGQVLAGEELKGPGRGRVVEYDLDGKLVRTWTDKGLLDAPWGFSVAPEGFGKFSGHLLVSNFGDGTITAFDPKSSEAVDYLKRKDGAVIKIDGIWGLMFGNGASLGEKDHLYFAAGPNDENDGIFGKIKVD